MFLLDILVNPVVRLEISIDTVFIIISSWRSIFEKKKVLYIFFLYWASKRFLQEHGHAFAYLIIITRAWSCIFLYITFVIYSFIRVIQTGYTCARSLSLSYLITKRKKKKKRTILNACALTFDVIVKHDRWVSFVSYPWFLLLDHTLKLGSNDETRRRRRW